MRGRRKLQDEELHNLHLLSYIIIVIKQNGEMGKTFSTHGRHEKFKKIYGKEISPNGKKKKKKNSMV
jgi:hypothetical protein